MSKEITEVEGAKTGTIGDPVQQFRTHLAAVGWYAAQHAYDQGVPPEQLFVELETRLKVLRKRFLEPEQKV